MRHVTHDAILVAVLVAWIVGSGNCAPAQQMTAGQRFVVTSGHPDATAAGIAVLKGGGNVVDAAITTSLCLGVAEPYGSGIGGKAMLLYRDGKMGQVYSIEAMCAASDSIDADRFANRPERERYYGYTSVAVPGLVAALNAAHQKWGSRKWQELVAPAADLADRGVVVSEKMYQLMRPKRNLLRRDTEAARVYLVDGETPAVGAVMKYPDLAGSLRRLAVDGAKAFYEGEIAERIVAAAKKGGANLTISDFRNYKPRIGEPLSVTCDGCRIYSCPPPLTGGITVLATLRALDGVAALDVTHGRDAKYIDLVGRILLSVYPKVNMKFADVPMAIDDAHRFLADESISSIRKEAEAVELQKVSSTFPSPRDVSTLPPFDTTLETFSDADASTTHLIVADRDGNIVCLTQSLSYHFGACVVPPGTGIILNDSMSNFSTADSAGCNYVAPGKRERSTIAPIIVTKDGHAELALGIPGGQRIPTTTIQLLIDVLQFGTPLDEAFDRARFHVRRSRTAKEADNIVDLEGQTPTALDKQLAELGWRPERILRDGHYFGGGSAVLYQNSGALQGVADLRRTNSAIGD